MLYQLFVHLQKFDDPQHFLKNLVNHIILKRVSTFELFKLKTKIIKTETKQKVCVLCSKNYEYN